MRNDPLVEILKKNFAQRQTRNRAYSLRSFSRDLNIDASNLSKILSYQKEIGPKLRAKLGEKLGFEKAEVEGWLSPSRNTRTSNSDYSHHELQVFELVSEWQHYALLEYFKIPGVSQTPKGIAESMGLTLEKTRQSLSRLVETGMIIKTMEGYKPAGESSSSILSVATSKAHREQQKQILEGAIDALENVPIEDRSQSSMTLAIDSEKLDEAKELIKNFRRDLGRFLSKSSALDNVYQLSISLYPVTKFKNKQRK